MQGDDPPFLPVGTDVSAKYKGAFCEAKIKKVVRNIKCKVTLKAGGGTITVNDDVIKGTLRVGSTVEVKQDPKKDAMEAVIAKIQDCSQYTVVFDDGDITTLRRSALCLKSGRHFNESETLDQLPLTHPEHFSTPVIAGRRGRRGRAQSDESDGSGPCSRPVKESSEREPHVGRVVLVEAAAGAERRRPHQPAFPALVVAPTAQIKVKEDYLVRSFKDGRYYTVPKKEAREFRAGSAPLEWAGVSAALQYLNQGVLPPHWDRDTLFHEANNTSDDSSDDEPREEKDHFVAQLYKFMDDRGTPLNRNPTIANRDIDLYRLFRVVQKLGGYNRVTNQNQWKSIADKMGFHPVTTNITNLCKQAYKKFLHSFEDFYRKLGVTLVAHPRGARTPPAGRSLIRDRDKQLPATPTTPTTPTMRGKDKDSDKSETEKSDKSEKEDKVEKAEKKEKPRASDGEDSADNQPLIITTTPKVEKEKEKEKEKDKEIEKDKEKEKDKDKEKEKDKDKDKDKEKIKEKDKDKETDKEKEKEKDKDKDKEKEKVKEKEKEKEKSSTPASTSDEKTAPKRSLSKTRSLPPAKPDSHDKRTPKRRPLSSKGISTSANTSRASRRPHASTDSDSSGRASRYVSRCGPTKKMSSRRSQSANSASSGNTIASASSTKRVRKRKTTEPSSEPTRSGNPNAKAQVGDKLKVYYGPTQSESKVTYEAKVIEISSEGMLRVHYTGWNTRYDEWITPQRIALNVTQHEARNKKNPNISRRARSKRIEGKPVSESSARSDSDSDSDSDEDVKRPPKKLSVDDKGGIKTPSRSKDAKSSDSSSSSKPRKRPVRTASTPSAASPAKRPRPSAGHQGRDYDLNEIRSELKGLHTVKQEPDDAKELPEKSSETTSPPQPPPTVVSPPQPEKQAEDVYEFKEPEPFELELHDEKKKRTHRIFDDISPSKYTSTLSKSLSEEISEDPLRIRPSTLRSPSLSPFRDFGTTRDIPSRQSPEEDSKDDLFSLDDDSFPGESSSGPIFEGFTPAKNQETYSKKSKVSKLRQLIEDSPDSRADDEQSSEDEPEDIVMKEEERDPSPSLSNIEPPKTPEPPPKEDVKEPPKEVKIEVTEPEERKSPKTVTPEPPKSPPLQTKLELPSTSIKPVAPSPPIVTVTEPPKEEPKIEKEEIKLASIPLPAAEPVAKQQSVLRVSIEKLEPEPAVSKIELPSSPQVDTEEDKSEPDSPARIDVLPEPPPGFLLQSEGPKIAEKLLKAINSAKRLSMTPSPVEERPLTPKKDTLKLNKPEGKQSPIAAELKTTKLEPNKPLTKIEPVRKFSPIAVSESIFGEPSNLTDAKRDTADVKKVKPKEPSPPRLQSPLSILERRKSVADLPLPPGKNNKVLSDTIQKLSSQINQSAATASIPLPSFPPEEKSESSDSDDSERRMMIIEKLSTEDWGSGGSSETSRGVANVPANPVPGPVAGLSSLARGIHAGKSPGEWSAGESLLMLEDACKNERKHSASVVVAGSGRVGAAAAAGGPSAAAAGEEDSNISLLLCEETIPGSPAPDAEPAPPRRLHLPFACAPPHHNTNSKEERRGEAGPARALEAGEELGPGGGAGGAGAGAGWGRRHALLDNTPPTTPDSSLDMSPHRERRMSERDSPLERKDDDDESRPADSSPVEMDKPHGGRSRKASESSAAGASSAPRARGRRRRDTDTTAADHTPHKYNFYVDLDPNWDCQTRISVLTSRLADLRKAYHSVKAELAAIDRRRKKLRRKEREAVKAAKAACS
ncbi:AT-rich interactive domain-containing protein 4A isoform X2 [Plodia interpunctella]|uniref:AT-rich interactive domain-containing protein 4A isoform X2 n=1 Tax=Plodia interpunctella TaxID=58824 RepID=UPI002368215F|nr:AT-rich interactive domain-containing protein 4A isoform X2 [Plodia interpunctella]